VTTQVWIALIAAVASLAVALLSAWRAGRTQQRLAELTDSLQEQRAERDGDWTICSGYRPAKKSRITSR
jgi:hypothetical protein